jgi:hypothetical protein
MKYRSVCLSFAVTVQKGTKRFIELQGDDTTGSVAILHHKLHCSTGELEAESNQSELALAKVRLILTS